MPLDSMFVISGDPRISRLQTKLKNVCDFRRSPNIFTQDSASVPADQLPASISRRGGWFSRHSRSSGPAADQVLLDESWQPASPSQVEAAADLIARPQHVPNRHLASRRVSLLAALHVGMRPLLAPLGFRWSFARIPKGSLQGSDRFLSVSHQKRSSHISSPDRAVPTRRACVRPNMITLTPALTI